MTEGIFGCTTLSFRYFLVCVVSFLSLQGVAAAMLSVTVNAD